MLRIEESLEDEVSLESELNIKSARNIESKPNDLWEKKIYPNGIDDIPNLDSY